MPFTDVARLAGFYSAIAKDFDGTSITFIQRLRHRLAVPMVMLVQIEELAVLLRYLID